MTSRIHDDIEVRTEPPPKQTSCGEAQTRSATKKSSQLSTKYREKGRENSENHGQQGPQTAITAKHESPNGVNGAINAEHVRQAKHKTL
jgi:hypothetical protein